MRFFTFVKQYQHPETDPDINAFVQWTKEQEKLHLSSDPRILAFPYCNKLNPTLTRGYQKLFLLYAESPENQIPKDLQHNQQQFLQAINTIVLLQMKMKNGSIDNLLNDMGTPEESHDESDRAELFQQEMEEYLEEYETYLEQEEKLKPATVDKHAYIIGFFIEELNAGYQVTGFEEITPGMCGSKFVRSFNSHCDEALQLQTAKNTLYRFFHFIHQTHGIANRKLLDQLKKK